ncbi:MAG: aminotransferase class I/II-fold pyridoxal phosphate-dependent enzyme [bacterium]|nr:aminotransferase class I/II-fold pyridoxal phosphate-dependent enzyme [bacterium]
MKIIDLRSDTITKPSSLMRKAIAEAEVGDDVFEEDPTVNRLQEMAADIFDKEAALYVPSGTMANEIAVNIHTQPGEEVILDRFCHILNYENGAPGFLSGVNLYPIDGNNGIMTSEQVEKAIRHYPLASPVSSLVSLENTHNYGGGTIYPIEEIRKISEIAANNSLKRHLDGARLFNAVIATGIKPEEYSKYFDSVSFCLSKGLGAPIGSLLLGSGEFISEARRIRRVFGGGMRQLGIIAAAGIYALENNIERLAEDHQNARKLSVALNSTETFYVDLKFQQTNIVIAEIEDPENTAENISDELHKIGVLAFPFGENRVRFVLHLDVTAEDITEACSRIKKNFK